MPSTFLHITREGWPWLLGVLLAALLVYQHLGPLPAVPLWWLSVFTAVYFWESDRSIPPRPMGVVAPVDGVVVAVEEVQDELLARPARRVGIRIRPFASYMLRAATEGQVTELSAQARARLDGRSASWLHSDEGHDVLMVVERGSLLGARPCRIAYGERVGQGRRCGVRRLARQIDVYVPADSRAEVNVGDAVSGGETVLATLARIEAAVQTSSEAA